LTCPAISANMQLRAVNRLATFPPDHYSVFYAIFRVYTNHEKEPILLKIVSFSRYHTIQKNNIVNCAFQSKRYIWHARIVILIILLSLKIMRAQSLSTIFMSYAPNLVLI
ncbi:MAG TPA: hypothetical protein H9665_05120, partial [Firmicutes bacterium]|nr:hypothetical protein [Bacillota bacterium]